MGRGVFGKVRVTGKGGVLVDGGVLVESGFGNEMEGVLVGKDGVNFGSMCPCVGVRVSGSGECGSERDGWEGEK